MSVQNIERKIIGFVFAIVSIIVLFFMAVNIKNKSNQNIAEITDPEILRAISYGEITDADKKVDGCDYVEFSAFFTRDLNGDGYAEKVKGSCREISQTDTMYAELNVLTQGSLRDAKITVNGENFVWQTAIVEDQIVKGDYIGETSEITLQPVLNAGSQKLLWGTTKANIGNNINNYTKDATITLTGKYYDEDGNFVCDINQTRNLTVDWHGVTETEVNKYYYSPTFYESYGNQVLDIATVVQEDSIDLNFKVAVAEKNQKLYLKKQEVQLTIPQLNGYSATEVSVAENNIEKNYNAETGILTIAREAEVDDNGNITKSVARSNLYNVKIKYPLEAYDQISADSIVLNIPIKGINEGYNNTNSEFQNPYVSEAEGILTITYSKPSGNIWNIYSYVGNYEKLSGTNSYRYQVSKEAPNDIFNGNVYEDKTTTYPVKWNVVIGDYTAIDKIQLQDQKKDSDVKSDEFLSSSNTYTSMRDYATTKGVYFENASQTLGNDGWIKLYNVENGEEEASLLETFTKDNWSTYTKENPYAVNTKAIKIETSNPVSNTSFYVYQIKEMDDELITENFSKEEFDKLSYVYTNLKGTIDAPEGITYEDGETTSTIYRNNYAYYDAPYSVAKLTVDSEQITNQKTENVNFTITTSSESSLEKYWLNGAFIIELPESIINASVNSVEVSDEDVEIQSCDVVEENGRFFIKIYTKNEEEKIYNIKVNASVAGNPLNPTEVQSVKLYAYNENCNNYYNKEQDIHDLDSDGRYNNDIGSSTTSMRLIAPSGLLTTEYVTDYDDADSITIAPNVADIEKADETRTANINVSITNGYSGTISDVVILGRVPFEGNKYVLNGGDLNSKYTANITGEINVPDGLQEYATIYYSTNENASKDIDNEENGWKSVEEITDWSEVKSYLIDLNGYTLAKEESEVFTYEVAVPAGLGYNSASFSSHAVYYNLDTENGKLAVQTEPNKVGIQVVAKYSLQLTKNKKAFDNMFVKGATYKVTTTDVDGNEISKTATTNENGILTFRGLYVDREYTLTEIASPIDYVLSNEEIKFIGKIEDDGILTFETTEGSFKNVQDNSGNEVSTVEVMVDNNQNYLVKAGVEDEAKYNLVINKKDNEDNYLSQIRFLLKGSNVNKLLKTDDNGKIIVDGLCPYEEYTIKEIQADGYYLEETPKTFRLVRGDDGNLVVEFDNSENIVISTNELDGNARPIITFDITNEKIPTYELHILKVEENLTEENVGNLNTLSEAKFLVESIDTGDINEYTTNDNGLISISELYQYRENKNITGEYIIKETKAPNGYSNNAEEVHIIVGIDEENELKATIKNSNQLSTYKTLYCDGNIVTLVLQDKPLFKLTKVDSEKVDENGSPIVLSNAEFIIYELDENGQVVDYAKDVNGNYVGTQNEAGDYTVITDDNGTILLPLRGGTYKSIEVTYPDNYQELSNVDVFKVQGEDAKSEQDGENTTLEINYIEDLVDLSNDVNSGKSYSNTRVKLMRTLDFNEDGSYRNAQSDTYGDLNEDGSIDTIKEELTKESGIGFTPIGSNASICFSGIFEGNNNEIRNIYINSTREFVGLFGYAKYAIIKDVGITGSICTNSNENSAYIGAVVGYIDYGSISNCYNNAEINGDSKLYLYIGGIVGRAYENNCSISNCHNTSKVEHNRELYGYTYLGGIVGYGNNIKNCYNEGEIVNYEGNITSSSYDSLYTGGIVGYGSNITNCYNTANISCKKYLGSNYTGGVSGCGSNIVNCYNLGQINVTNEGIDNKYASTYIGGISGSGSGIKKSFNKNSIICETTTNSFTNYVGGIVGRKDSSESIEQCYNERRYRYYRW